MNLMGGTGEIVGAERELLRDGAKVGKMSRLMTEAGSGLWGSEMHQRWRCMPRHFKRASSSSKNYLLRVL